MNGKEVYYKSESWISFTDFFYFVLFYFVASLSDKEKCNSKYVIILKSGLLHCNTRFTYSMEKTILYSHTTHFSIAVNRQQNATYLFVFDNTCNIRNRFVSQQIHKFDIEAIHSFSCVILYDQSFAIAISILLCYEFLFLLLHSVRNSLNFYFI